jgi:tRNA threonylcarbamoyladenosine biosynthesis protein TsaE
VREVTVPTAEDMRALAAGVAGELAAGDLVVLTGDLGAGKTTFVQGLARGLGIDAAVTSPTFVIARVYRGGRLPLVHVDAYRLGSEVEVDDLDLDADVGDSVTVVEWGAGLVERLADHRLEVHIERGVDDTDETRGVTILARPASLG